MKPYIGVKHRVPEVPLDRKDVAPLVIIAACVVVLTYEICRIITLWPSI